VLEQLARQARLAPPAPSELEGTTPSTISSGSSAGGMSDAV
jgi:hypothetical protein